MLRRLQWVFLVAVPRGAAMIRLTLTLISAALLIAVSLPAAVTQPVIVPVYKTPRMWLSCDKQMERERKWACNQRRKST